MAEPRLCYFVREHENGKYFIYDWEEEERGNADPPPLGGRMYDTLEECWNDFVTIKNEKARTKSKRKSAIIRNARSRNPV